MYPGYPRHNLTDLLKFMAVTTALGLVCEVGSMPFRKPEVHHTRTEIAQNVEEGWKIESPFVYADGSNDMITVRSGIRHGCVWFYQGLDGIVDSVRVELRWDGSQQATYRPNSSDWNWEERYEEVRLYLERRTPR